LSQFRKSVIDSANVWIYVLDAEANVLVWNRAAEKICGYAKDMVVGTNKIWQLLYPDKKYREKISIKTAKIIKDGKALDDLETMICCKDSSKKIISWNFKNLTGDSGNIIGSIAIGRDITELKEKERFINIHRKLTSTFSGISNLDKTLKICINTALKEADMDCGGFYILDKYTGDFELKYSKGLSREFTKITKLIKRNSAQAALIMKGKPVYKFYPELDFNIDPIRKKEKLKAISVLPIKYNGKVIACLNIASYTIDNVEDYNKSILELIANEAGATIVRSKDRKKLEDSEKKYRLLIGSINDSIFVLDKNDCFSQQYTSKKDGLYDSPENFIGKKHKEIMPPAIHKKYSKASKKVRKKGGVAKYEYLIPMDGKNKWFNAILSLHDDGESIVAVIRDITGRKKTEIKIKESEERYRILVETLPARIWSKDKDSTFISCNKTLADDLGVKKENIAGKTDYDFFSKKEADNYRKDDRETMKSGKTLYIEESQIQHGKNLIIHTIKTPLRDGKGNIYGTLGMFWDITDRRNTEEELKNSEERFKIMFESAPEAYYLIDLKGTFINVNMTAEKMLGHKREELIGENPLKLKLITAPYIRKAVKLMADNAMGLQSTGPADIIVNRKDGKRIIIELSIHPVKINNKLIILAAARDITDKKKAEENLKYLSFHDRMTHTYNRAYFEEELARINSGRQLPISIIIGDVNGLKLINDAFGHDQGDKLLINTAAILNKCCRKDDIVARYGGDEFAIILPKTSAVLCAKVLKRIRNAINKTKNHRIPLSISLGMATKEKKSRDINKVLRKAEDNMYTRKLIEAKSISSSIISSLTESLWQKDIETRKHADRLEYLALKMGEKLKLPENQLANLSLLATLHDIGKLTIPVKILKNKNKLTKKQWAVVKRHPEAGSRIAQASPMLLPIANLILSHHEWWDGSGYPRGISKRHIPLEARIISIIDAYDVMTTGRPYKKKMTKEKAIKELKDCSGTQFHPRFVDVFIDILKQNS